MKRNQLIIIAVVAIIIAGIGGYFSIQGGGEEKKENEYITIGRSLSFSGDLSKAATMAKKGWEAWMHYVNEEQGGIHVNGKTYKVRTKYYDDESKPSIGLEMYRKLINRDKVDFIVGPYSSAVTRAVQPAAEGKKMLMLSPEGTDPTLWSRGMHWPLMAGPPGLSNGCIKVLTNWLKSIPESKAPNKVGVLAEDKAYTKSIAEYGRQYTKDIGMNVVYYKLYPASAKDVKPYLEKARANGAEVIIGGGYFPGASLIIKTIREMDWTPKAVFLTIGPVQTDWTKLGETGDYVMSPSCYSKKLNTPGNEYLINYVQEHWGHDPDYHCGRDFAAGQMFKAAIEGVGKIEKPPQDETRKYILNHTIDTVVGPRKTKDEVEIGGTTYNNIPPGGNILVQRQKGELEVIFPPAVASADPVYPFPSWEER